MRFRFGAAILICSAAACTTKTPPRVSPTPAPAPQAETAPLPLLPVPGRIERAAGAFEFTSATVIYAEEAFAPSARFLSDLVGLAFGAQPPRVEVLAGEPPDGAVVIRRKSPLRATGSEAFELDISPVRISIVADEAAGAFYGVQTLRQLLPPAFEYEALRAPRRNAPPVAVPAVRILDSPRFPWRGAMLDVARHFLTVDEVKRYVDLMALH